MGMYIDYFKYVCEHKKNVMKICFKHKKYKMGLLHDWNKFLPDEFIPYARYFYGNPVPDAALNVPGIKGKDKVLTKSKVNRDFDKAWIKHYKRSKHHWERYVMSFHDYIDNRGSSVNTPMEIAGTDVLVQMPDDAIEEMVYDWMAMSVKFGGTAQEYYLKHYHEIKMHSESRLSLEEKFNFIELYDARCTLEYPQAPLATLEELARMFGEVRFREFMHRIEEEYNIENVYDVVVKKGL